MRKLFVVPAALVAIGVAACAEHPTEVVAPQFELVDEDLQLGGDATHHIFATFSYEMGGGTAGRVLTGGEPAIFPGNPKNAGTCFNGKWHNPQGKPTAGTPENPHPFCYQPGSAGIRVELEKISGVYEFSSGNGSKTLYFSNVTKGDGDALDDDSYAAKWLTRGTNASTTKGNGLIEAWAVNASDNTRVGKITFDLDEEFTAAIDYFDCDLNADIAASTGCLSKVITTAKFYKWTGVNDGDGKPVFESTFVVLSGTQGGFLYWVPIP